LLEVNGQLVERNGAAARIGMNRDVGRHGIRQTQIIGRRHAVHQHAQLITARHRIQSMQVLVAPPVTAASLRSNQPQLVSIRVIKRMVRVFMESTSFMQDNLWELQFPPLKTHKTTPQEKI
jgi:hypothetical protein